MTMNLYDQLNDIFPYLVSIRKLENYISVDIVFPNTWKLPKKYVDEKMVLEQKTEKVGFRFFSFATEFSEQTIDDLLKNLNGVIKYNLDREEKEKLFEQKVQELKTFFDASNLDELRELQFKLKNDFKLELADDEKGEDVKVAPRRATKR